jgi:hypothetical protein
LYPLACKSLAKEEAIIPFPKEEATPPVTKTYFVNTMYSFIEFSTNREDIKKRRR